MRNQLATLIASALVITPLAAFAAGGGGSWKQWRRRQWRR